MNRPISALLLAAACALSSGLRAAEAPVVRFGPLTVGMSVADARAALPQADWKVGWASPITGRVSRLSAVDALEFGGRRMKVDLRDERYDWHLELTARSTEPSVQACEQAGLAMLTALEQSAGPLQPGRDASGEALAFGSGSKAMWRALQDPGEVLSRRQAASTPVDRMSLSAVRTFDRLEVKGQVSYDARLPQNCSFFAIAIRWRPRPEPEVLAWDPARVRQQITVGERHRLAQTLSLPSDGWTVRLRCEVQRQSGAVGGCQPVDPAAQPTPALRVAQRHAARLVVDLSGQDRDDPQPMVTELPVTLSPTDRRPLDFGPPTVPSSGVSFAERPGAKALRSAYPSRAQRQGVAASVDLACQVQSDGSLVCQPAQAAGRDALGPLAVEFERAAETLAADYRSAPTLADGRPSAGVVIGLRVRFALED